MGSLVQLWNAAPQEVMGCNQQFAHQNSMLEAGPAGGGGAQLAGGPLRRYASFGRNWKDPEKPGLTVFTDVYSEPSKDWKPQVFRSKNPIKS